MKSRLVVLSAFATSLVTALPAQREEVTFTEHVAPIVFTKCASCHRAGDIAPFPLTTYNEVKKKARMIQRVTSRRIMPPWPPAKGDVPLKHRLALSEEQIETIAKWVAGGKLEGPADALPALPKFEERSDLGPPDLVVSMAKGFEVPAGGPDLYRSFVIPLDLEEDKWVVAFDVRPSARAVLHHTIIRYDTTGTARKLDGKDGKPGFERGMRLQIEGNGEGRAVRGRGQRVRGGSVGGWAVGRQPVKLPFGLGSRLPKGADLVLNSHIHPSGKKETERTTVRLWFSDKRPERTAVGIQLPPMFGRAAGLDIPPGKKDHRIQGKFTLPVDVLLIGVSAHAHYIAKTMKMTATMPEADEQTERKALDLFDIPNWDFNWQGSYQYEKPYRLPAGTDLHAVISYDNSAENPHQQFSPPRRVRFGPQSTDEMGSISLRVVAVNEEDTLKLRRAVFQNLRNSVGRRLANRGRSGGQWRGRLQQMDKNQDGALQKSEVPENWKRVFDRLDQNGDGKLDRDELRRLARRRNR